MCLLGVHIGKYAYIVLLSKRFLKNRALSVVIAVCKRVL